MPDKNIVLIHPPFCMPDKPYISTAVLFSYLVEQNIDVSVFDLNIEFYREYLSMNNINKALDFIENRFKILDNKPSLNSLEIQEYLKLVGLKSSMSGDPPPFHLLFENSRLSNSEQFILFGMGLNIVNTLYFPESLEFLITTGYIRYKSNDNKFSSHDLINSIKKPSLYSAIIKKTIAAYLKDKQPDIIGISVSFPDQVLPAFYTASVIKEMHPETHICLGGTFVSSHLRCIDNIHLFNNIDTFILDEGESPLLELIRCVNESKSFDHIPGLIYKRGNKIIKNEPDSKGLNKFLPQPDYSCVDLDKYLVNTNSMALLFRLSQGCYWHKCSFCRTELSFVKNHVCVELKEITGWIKNLVEKYPVRILHFTDDAADPELLVELSIFLIENNISIFWVTNMRFDSRITIEKLDLYKKAGCRAIYFGLESCNERVLKKMKKGISITFVEKTLKNCAEIGIPVNLYMIVGFPTETEEEALLSFSTVYNWKKNGLAGQVIYNVFEISGWSHISSNLQDYDITETYSSSLLDLDPPVTDFKCSGMERAKAESLCFDFITKLANINSFSKNNLRDHLLNDDDNYYGHEIQTQYDIGIIKSAIATLHKDFNSKEIMFKALSDFKLTK